MAGTVVMVMLMVMAIGGCVITFATLSVTVVFVVIMFHLANKINKISVAMSKF